MADLLDDPRYILHLFTYHEPTGEQVGKMGKLREKARELAHLIVEVCPPSADRSDAIRKLREVVMTTNAGIISEKQV